MALHALWMDTEICIFKSVCTNNSYKVTVGVDYLTSGANGLVLFMLITPSVSISSTAAKGLHV